MPIKREPEDSKTVVIKEEYVDRKQKDIHPERGTGLKNNASPRTNIKPELRDVANDVKLGGVKTGPGAALPVGGIKSESAAVPSAEDRKDAERLKRARKRHRRQQRLAGMSTQEKVQLKEKNRQMVGKKRKRNRGGKKQKEVKKERKREAEEARNKAKALAAQKKRPWWSAQLARVDDAIIAQAQSGGRGDSSSSTGDGHGHASSSTQQRGQSSQLRGRGWGQPYRPPEAYEIPMSYRPSTVRGRGQPYHPHQRQLRDQSAPLWTAGRGQSYSSQIVPMSAHPSTVQPQPLGPVRSAVPRNPDKSELNSASTNRDVDMDSPEIGEVGGNQRKRRRNAAQLSLESESESDSSIASTIRVRNPSQISPNTSSDGYVGPVTRGHRRNVAQNSPDSDSHANIQQSTIKRSGKEPIQVSLDSDSDVIPITRRRNCVLKSLDNDSDSDVCVISTNRCRDPGPLLDRDPVSSVLSSTPTAAADSSVVVRAPAVKNITEIIDLTGDSDLEVNISTAAVSLDFAQIEATYRVLCSFRCPGEGAREKIAGEVPRLDREEHQMVRDVETAEDYCMED